MQAPQDYCQTAADVRAAAQRITAWRRSLMPRPPIQEVVVEVVAPIVVTLVPAPAEPTITEPSIEPICLLPTDTALKRVADRPTINSVIEAVARAWSLSPDDLKGRSRKNKYVIPRQIAMTLAKLLTKRSLPEIGRRFDRDHTTVLHSLRKQEYLLGAVRLSDRDSPEAWAAAVWKILHPETDNGSVG